jgi:hypothetical protein
MALAFRGELCYLVTMAAVPSPRKATGARPRHSAVARLFLLAAFLVQSLFVQAHVHAAPLAAPEAIAVAANPAGDPAQHGQGDASSHCFQCWQAAVAGHYVAPPAILLPPAPQPDRFVSAEQTAEFGLGKFSHGWLGRGPPQ